MEVDVIIAIPGIGDRISEAVDILPVFRSRNVTLFNNIVD
jgi:hypothetical protein